MGGGGGVGWGWMQKLRRPKLPVIYQFTCYKWCSCILHIPLPLVRACADFKVELYHNFVVFNFRDCQKAHETRKILGYMKKFKVKSIRGVVLQGVP